MDVLVGILIGLGSALILLAGGLKLFVRPQPKPELPDDPAPTRPERRQEAREQREEMTREPDPPPPLSDDDLRDTLLRLHRRADRKRNRPGSSDD